MKDERLITVEEAADRLGISRSTAYELIADGQLDAIRIQRALRVEPAAIEKFKAAHRVKAAPKPAPAPVRRVTRAGCELGTDRFVN